MKLDLYQVSNSGRPCCSVWGVLPPLDRANACRKRQFPELGFCQPCPLSLSA
jgi:hypothetical protein